RAADRVAHDRLASRPPGEALVVGELEALEPGVVDSRVADHLRRDRSLRIGPSLLRIEADPGQVSLRELLRLRGIGEPLQVDEPAAPVEQARIELVRGDAEDLVRRERDRARISDLPWI